MTRVTLTNKDLQRLRTLVASGMKWRDAQRSSPKFRQIPLQSLWAMCKADKVFPKYRYREGPRRRWRVDLGPDLGKRASAHAAALGLTLTELVRDELERVLCRAEK